MKYYIIPATEITDEIEAENAADALIQFATGMEDDMTRYFRAVTEEELNAIRILARAKAEKENTLAFMAGELEECYGLTQETAESVAEAAYELYSSGKADWTQYECIEKAYEKYREEKGTDTIYITDDNGIRYDFSVNIDWLNKAARNIVSEEEEEIGREIVEMALKDTEASGIDTSDGDLKVLIGYLKDIQKTIHDNDMQSKISVTISLEFVSTWECFNIKIDGVPNSNFLTASEAETSVLSYISGYKAACA